MTVKTNVEAKSWLALLGRLREWNECAIAFPDEKFEPVAGQPYLIVQPVGLFFENEVISIDCGDEHRGTLNISTVVPFTWDYAAHIGLSGRVCDFFPNGSRYYYDDVSVQILDRPRAIFAPIIDGSGNRQEVQVNWRSWG